MRHDSLRPFSSSSPGASSGGLADDEGPASGIACAGVAGALLLACKACQDLSGASHKYKGSSRLLIIVMHGRHAAGSTRTYICMHLHKPAWRVLMLSHLLPCRWAAYFSVCSLTDSCFLRLAAALPAS